MPGDPKISTPPAGHAKPADVNTGVNSNKPGDVNRGPLNPGSPINAGSGKMPEREFGSNIKPVAPVEEVNKPLGQLDPVEQMEVIPPEPPKEKVVVDIPALVTKAKEIREVLDTIGEEASIDLIRAREQCRATVNWLEMAAKPVSKP